MEVKIYHVYYVQAGLVYYHGELASSLLEKELSRMYRVCPHVYYTINKLNIYEAFLPLK